MGLVLLATDGELVLELRIVGVLEGDVAGQLTAARERATYLFAVDLAAVAFDDEALHEEITVAVIAEGHAGAGADQVVALVDPGAGEPDADAFGEVLHADLALGRLSAAYRPGPNDGLTAAARCDDALTADGGHSRV